ncbi:cullin-associated NEDD8-dissociated protein-like protein [Pseudovirgaria hyperparasitica]|uniref:Cullin-associated NEDD8-dissociated protein-like protein n=1 Tax=Pseudovirgaria hyperparasitica TaxID=470096 RepID=A0A6A6WKU0_9PEZI|nr:cullin-associated NEDD8-dissociated protein-like protein [Pseudovirgaria hyperparasitica]KAF2762815.1 cullin-associated NEDD8-dissociated protein-like protein [Pseudovirgaria hyperparasitica]
MASAAIPLNPQASNVGHLLPKLYDADSDLRYMALNDLLQMFNLAHPNFLSSDYSICAKTVDGLLHTLNDTNGEVQNMAIKCLGPFVNKCPESILCPLLDKVSQIETGNIVDSSIPALALREIVVSFPRPSPGVPRKKQVQDAYAAISKALIPRLVGHNVMPSQKTPATSPPSMLQADVDAGTDTNAIDALTEVARCFGSMLHEREIEALLKTTFDILQAEKANSVLKKKSVVAISALAPHFSDLLLSSFISQLIENLGDPHLTHGKKRLYITILGSMSRSIPKKFGPYLKTLAPFVLSALSQEDLDEDMGSDEDESRDPEVDEVREAALTAIDGFLASCSQDMYMYTPEVVSAAIRFLKYDPNVRDDEDDDDDEDEMDPNDDFEDDDFEEDAGQDDEDDSSWKVRRCAAKALHTLIATRSGDLIPDGTLYQSVAPSLIGRFKEKEESVRLEVLSSLSTLVRNTGDGSASAYHLQANGAHTAMGPPPTRKRRRGGSDASMVDSQTLKSVSAGYDSPAPASPPTGPRANLASISPDIVRGLDPLLKTGPVPTKQASIILLRDIVLTQHGGLSGFLDQIMGPIIDAIRTSGTHATATSGFSSSVTANSLRMESLRLLGSIADLHSSKGLQPFLAKVVPVLIVAAQDKYSKVAVEALISVEQVIKALTPPRAASQEQQNRVYLEQLYDLLAHRISSKDVDTEVRRKAVHVLGLLIGRTSGTPDLLSPSKRQEGLDALLVRLKNELTRLATVRAVDVIAAHTQSTHDLSSPWVREVTTELGAQLRKSSRSLRGASLSALKTLTLSSPCRELLDAPTIKAVIEMLLPILSGEDLHMLGPALVILATFIKDNGKKYATPDFNSAVCNVTTFTVTGLALEAYLALVRAIGEQGAGKDLMQKFLSIGVSGAPDITGRSIGTLLVYGSQVDLGVKLEQFPQELKFPEDRRQCLAVTVLGEVGFQMGTNSPLPPSQFIECFQARSDKLPLAAAIAMGRAGSSNIKVFLPKILSAMGQQSSPQYLLMHSIKEILQHKEAEAEVLPYAQTLWQNLVAASQAEDNRAIGAECIGRLAIIDPKTYLPQLQNMLSDRNVIVRGMVTAALRYTLADTDESYDQYLRPIVIGMLSKMLNESDLENRRLGLTTFNSAMHNKPELILPHLNELLPFAMRETIIKPELIREVKMGPFTHKVDDGLEIRKSAYETLYALLESAFNRLNVSEFFDRVIAGIGDEHDIRILCNLMVTKLMVVTPDETSSRLQPISEKFRAVLSVKPKDNAVKQELEKMQESSKGVLKVSVQLNKTFAADLGSENPNSRAWQEYFGWASKEHGTLLKIAEDEMKEKER